MLGAVAEVVQDGQIVRLNLSEPMVPGTTFQRKGITFRVAGDGETAEPVVTRSAGLTVGKIDPGVLMWAVAIAAGWYFLVKRR